MKNIQYEWKAYNTNVKIIKYKWKYTIRMKKCIIQMTNIQQKWKGSNGTFDMSYTASGQNIQKQSALWNAVKYTQEM